ncbi:hypothetical protein R5R35_012053 [Gryllus longicercus]|uniref:Transmembrane protein 186 n=1 Tax=Gryllus longicercus TaxID=2509291 RepID=A0AAN9YXN5_9ORTH
MYICRWTYKILQHSRQYLSLRNCSSQISKYSYDKQSPSTQYIKIFEMPIIRTCRIISRFKLYHTALTAFVIPSSVLMYSTGFLEKVPIEPMVIGLAGCVIFYGSGYFLNNLIGAVYVNKSLDTVKLSYIDFWGQRMNMECPINDIVPLSDQPIEKKLFKMTKVELHSSPQKLKIATEHGEILLNRAFDNVFFRVNSNIQKNSRHQEK